MELKRINSTELRTNVRDLMERVKFHGDHFVVETFGRPMAVIISFDDYVRMCQVFDNPVMEPSNTVLSLEAKGN